MNHQSWRCLLKKLDPSPCRHRRHYSMTKEEVAPGDSPATPASKAAGTTQASAEHASPAGQQGAHAAAQAHAALLTQHLGPDAACLHLIDSTEVSKSEEALGDFGNVWSGSYQGEVSTPVSMILMASEF